MPPTPPRQPAMQASARMAAASAWLSGARWKLLAMRGTRAVPASLAEEALPEASRVTMRVFAEGCPAGCLREVIELLTAEREVRDPVVDGTVQPGLWLHRLAVWSRDGDSTKTVVRDFCDGELSFGAVVESGCSSETSVRYVFDAVEAEALPPFAQGTVVRIGGLSRDRETGLFSYYVTETVRKTRAVGFRVVSDTAFETVSEARWDGVYGTPERPETHLGVSVTGIPSAGVQPAGTTVSVQWDQDPQDCTWAASARKTVAKKDAARGYSCDRDVFKTDHSTATSGADPDTVDAHAPGPDEETGAVSSLSVQNRPDGLADVTSGVRTELTVAEAAVRVRGDVFRRSETVTGRSERWAEAVAKLGLAGASAGVLKSVGLSKTPSGRADTVVSTETEIPVARARVTVSRDAFGTVEAVTGRSVDAAEPAVPSSFTPGELVETAAELTPGGRRDVSKSKRVSTPYPDAEVTFSETAFARQTRAAYRFARARVADFVAAAKGFLYTQSSSAERDGTFTNTQEVTESKPVANAVVTRSEDLFFARESAADRSLRAEGPAPAAPAGGVVEDLRRELNQDLTVDESRGRSTEKEVLEASAQYTVLPWMTLRKVSDRHTAAPHPVDGSRPGSVGFSRTPGALYDRSRTEVLPGSVSDGFVMRHTRGGDLFTDFEDIDTLWSYKSWDGLDPGLSGGGVEGGAKITTVTFSAREDGTFIRSVRTESVKAHVWYEVRKTYRRFNTQTLGQDSCVMWSWSFVNASFQRVLNVFNSVSAEDLFRGLRFSYRLSFNRFGLMDGSIGVTMVTGEEA